MILVICKSFIMFLMFFSVVWDIMRCWVKLYPVKRKANQSPGTIILDKEPEVEASFEKQSGANPLSRKQKLLRFQPNPETNWGPKARYGYVDDD